MSSGTPGGGLGRRRRLVGNALSLALPAATALVLTPLTGVTLVSDALILLLATVAVALVGGWLAALVAAVVSSLLLNYLFIPPRGTWRIEDGNDALALIVFLVVALLVSSAVDVAARRTRQAARSAAEAGTLAELATAAAGGADALDPMLERVRSTLALDALTLLQHTAETWDPVATAGPAVGADSAYVVPAGVDRLLAVSGGRPDPESARVLQAVAAQVAAVLDRVRLAEAAGEAESLAAANQMRTALLAAVGHDLRAPLAAAKASVSSLRSRDVTLDAGDRRELLAAADESLDRLAALVEDLLDMSRLQAGATALHVQATSVDEVVARSLDDLGPDGRRVLVEVPEDLPSLAADAALLERVLVNLVANALRYSPADRPPMLTAGSVGDRVELRVVDRGPGIPAEARDRVFLPFQRLGDTDNGVGVGLGLALARGLTEAMGGSVEPEETPGGGLTMVISLPVADAPAASPGLREREGVQG